MSEPATPQYSIPPGLLEALAQYAPGSASILGLSDLMVGGYTKKHLGRTFSELDSPWQRPETSLFRTLDSNRAASAIGALNAVPQAIDSNTWLGRMGNTGYTHLLEQQQQMNQAYENSLGRIGAGYSLSDSTRLNSKSISESYAGATSTNDLSAYFISHGFSDGALTWGERGVLLGRLADRGGAAGYEKTAGMGSGEAGAAKAASISTNIKQMESAIADWEKVLNTDIKGVLDSLEKVFGGDAISMFTQSGSTLRQAALTTKHAAALSGLPVAGFISNLEKIGKVAGVYGGPSDMVYGMAMTTAMYGDGLTGYRTTADKMMASTADIGAQAIASRTSQFISGAYQQWRMTEGQGLPEEEAYKTFTGLWQGIKGEVNVNSLRKATGVSGNGYDLIEASKGNFGQDYAMNHAGIMVERSITDTMAVFRAGFLTESSSASQLMEKGGISENDLFDALSGNPTEIGIKLRELLGSNTDQGLQDAVLDLQGYSNKYADRTLKKFLPYLQGSTTGRELIARTPTEGARSTAKLKEARVRAQIEAEMNISGVTRAVAAARMLVQGDDTLGPLMEVLLGVNGTDTLPDMLRPRTPEDNIAAANSLRYMDASAIAAKQTAQAEINGLLAKGNLSSEEEKRLATLRGVVAMDSLAVLADKVQRYEKASPGAERNARLADIETTSRLRITDQGALEFRKAGGSAGDTFKDMVDYAATQTPAAKLDAFKATITGYDKIMDPTADWDTISMAKKDRMAKVFALETVLTSEEDGALKTTLQRMKDSVKEANGNTILIDEALQEVSTHPKTRKVYQEAQGTAGVTVGGLQISAIIEMITNIIGTSGFKLPVTVK